MKSSGIQASNQEPKKSMQVTKLEKEMKVLKDENSKLKADLNDVRTLYKQLIQENSHEKFDERRITVLKSQIIQLERQILLMSEALSSRSAVLFEVENALSWIADKCRFYISKEVRAPAVPVERADLTVMVETTESARLKLFKQSECHLLLALGEGLKEHFAHVDGVSNTNIRSLTLPSSLTAQNNSKENLARPLMLVTEFLQPHKKEDVTLLDISMGQLSHINLKHVGKLESKLSVLYKDLVCLHEMLYADLTLPPNRFLSHHLSKDVHERLSTHLLKACAQANDCIRDLLDLSLLYPNAPGPTLKKRLLKDITLDDISSSLPKMNKTKMIEIMKVIDALFKVFSHKHHFHTHEIKTLKEELMFHNAVYDLQIKYSESLIDTVKDAYVKFEQSTQDIIADPLRDILDAYEDLKNTASEDALKEFLKSFKNNADQLTSAVESFHMDKKGSAALSEYGEQFYRTLDSLITKNQRRRDAMVKERDDIKDMQNKLNDELKELIKGHKDESDEYDDGCLGNSETISKLKNEPALSDDSFLQNSENPTEYPSASENSVQEMSTHEKAKLQPIQRTPVSKSVSEKPPTSRTMKSRIPEATPRSYKANTFIPKRTLKLKKSGSTPLLPKDDYEKPDWDSSVDTSPDIPEQKPVRTSNLRRSSASGVSCLIKGKPESSSTSDISTATPISKIKSKSQSEGRISQIGDESPGWNFSTDISYEDPSL